MIKRLKQTLAITLFFSVNSAYASPLNKQIDDFFHYQLNQIAESITINYPNTLPELTCAQPSLSLVNKNSYWGKVTLAAQCANKKTFIQLNIEIVGNYFVTQQKIAAGKQIAEQDISEQLGRLDQLPKTVITNKDHIINSIASRNIDSNQPFLSTMIRPNWYAKAGQTNKVIIKGDGYQIVSNGKPLTNGTLGDYINVRMNNGKVINGIVTENGIFIFDKKD